MTSFAKPISFFPIIVLIFSPLQIIQAARQSVYFSKVTPYNTNNNNDHIDNVPKEVKIIITEALTPTAAPTAAPAPAPAPALPEAPEEALVPTSGPTRSYSVESEYGDNGKSPSSKETQTIIDAEDEILAEELSGSERFDQRVNYENNNLYNTKYNQDKGYTSSYNGHSYVNNNNNYNGNRNRNRNSHEIIEQQGMSDTRFLENGQYYHDLKNEINNNFHGNYGSGRGSTSSNAEGYYDNYIDNSDEFNTEEEYNKYQETHGYVP